MILLVILIALMMLCLILIVVAIIRDFPTLGQYASIGLLILLVIGVTIDICTPNYEPTAIDVYRGKTTLEITYRDSVAIDSVVVYKVK